MGYNKIKMFAMGWVKYPRPRGSPEPTWDSVLHTSCQVGSGDPLVLGYTTILILNRRHSFLLCSKSRKYQDSGHIKLY